ncbi:HET-domain-containing protein, partial [Polyplosphaeria fusca]
EWLTFCREDHQSMCGNNSNGMVPGLKVLDCRTGQLTPADPHSPYVALSYVWGEPTGEHLIRNADTDYMPKTIRDAMKVALRLNFQYLWVDRYCIDQENPDEKRQMIASMGQIYTNAEITIIAVAGTNPEYGLPGVSSTPRRPQYAVKIGHETHVLVMDPLEELNQSKWNSRGWTWQEMLLSRRRLAFSNDQICFQCRDMHCLE